MVTDQPGSKKKAILTLNNDIIRENDISNIQSLRTSTLDNSSKPKNVILPSGINNPQRLETDSISEDSSKMLKAGISPHENLISVNNARFSVATAQIKEENQKMSISVDEK